MTSDYYKDLRILIDEADESGMIFCPPDVDGHSGKKLLGLLQRAARYSDRLGIGDYLEIGVYQGLSLVSVASVLGRSTAYGVDNFSQFDPLGNNKEKVLSAMHQAQLRNVKLINMDFEDALADLYEFIGNNQIATYFVDGPHDYRSQLLCLNLIKPFLAPRAVLVVDDSNYDHVRLANRDFLVANPEYKLLFEAYTPCHPRNMSARAYEAAREGWWNGVNVIVRDTDDWLECAYPPTERNRQLFLNEHLVHSHGLAGMAIDSLALLDLLYPLRAVHLFRRSKLLRNRVKNHKTNALNRYTNLETHSEALPVRRLNPRYN